MISLQNVGRFFLNIGLVVMLTMVMAFSVASANSWATTSLTKLMSQPQTHIAAMNRAEEITKNIGDKAQAVMDKMGGDSKDQSMGGSKELEAKTETAINNSIENPNYQPGGKIQKAENQANESAADIKSGVREAFK